MKWFEIATAVCTALLAIYFFRFGQEQIRLKIQAGKMSATTGDRLKGLIRPLSFVVFTLAIVVIVLAFADE